MTPDNILMMESSVREEKPSVLQLLNCKCPRCRKGNMFIEKNPYVLSKTLKMHEQCLVCGQPFQLEVGFYYGSSYVSYALCIFISAAFLVTFWLTIGFSLDDNRFFYWLALNAVLLIGLQPVLMRMARAIWLALFVRYNKDWKTIPAAKPERINEAQMNNW